MISCYRYPGYKRIARLNPEMLLAFLLDSSETRFLGTRQLLP